MTCTKCRTAAPEYLTAAHSMCGRCYRAWLTDGLARLITYQTEREIVIKDIIMTGEHDAAE